MGLDRDRDGLVRRDEWPGDDRSFNAHDWNRDGLLSGDEIKEAERAEAGRRAADVARPAAVRRPRLSSNDLPT